MNVMGNDQERTGDLAQAERQLVGMRRLLLWKAHRLGVPPQDVEDRVQETCMRVCKALRGLCCPVTIRAFALTTLHNVVRDANKADHRYRLRLRPIPLLDYKDAAGPDRYEESGPVTVAVQSLSPLYDETLACLLQHEGSAHAYEDIADDLHIPMGTVKSRIWRIRAAVKKAMRS